MAPAQVTQDATSSTTQLPSEIANQFASLLNISTDQAQQFIGLLKQAVPAIPEPPFATGARIEADAQNEMEKIRASKLEIKIVHEFWDPDAHTYKIKESPQTTSKDQDEWMEYLFVLRLRFDQKNKQCAEYLDIKSEELRDILRVILKDVRGISLRENKPTVKPTILFNYLSQLEAYQTSHETQHLEHLTRFLRDHYPSTIESLNALWIIGRSALAFSGLCFHRTR